MAIAFAFSIPITIFLATRLASYLGHRKYMKEKRIKEEGWSK